METINASEIHGIIFDYGGTLDSRGDHWSEIIWQGWQKAGVLTDKPTFREAYVYAEREMAKVRHITENDNFLTLLRAKIKLELQWLAEQGKFNPSEISAKSEAAAQFCYDYAKKCVEESRPVLNGLAAHYPMVLVSNFYGNISAVLADYGLDGYFRKIIESAVVGVRKPDPKIFALGVEALGMPASEVLVVGDSLRKDILPARSLGCATLWLKGKGWTAEEDAATDPSQIAALKDICEILGVSPVNKN